MDTSTTKRLNLIDAIVLVAATAVGFALGRPLNQRLLFDASNDVVALYVVSIALMWTLAILALNLTRYRTTLQGMSCRPGFTAMLAIFIERTADAISNAITDTIGPFGSFSEFSSIQDWLWSLLSGNVLNVLRASSSAKVVVAVWLVTAMAGCWRAEKTWIDRTGRALGVFWLLAAAAYWLSFWVFPRPPSMGGMMS